MTIFNDNAALFATTADVRIAQLRREAVRNAARARLAGDPGRADAILRACLAKQARIAGIRGAVL